VTGVLKNIVVRFMMIFLFSSVSSVAGAIVISEIQYNPPEAAPHEFVELYNSSDSTVDLSNYAFTAGIDYVFPENTLIAPHQYILVVQNPNAGYWRTLKDRVYGPYSGRLSDQGERLELRNAQGQIVERLEYTDFSPWSRGADGYGPSLERISADLPAADFHSWRGSIVSGGTPGRVNSVAGLPERPALLGWQISPKYPTSDDKVMVEIILDSAQIIDAITLNYESWKPSSRQTRLRSLTMKRTNEVGDLVTFSAQLPAQDSQSLVRMNFEVERTDGEVLFLPHQSEPRPFESYFVYDGEIDTLLPLAWIFPLQETQLPELPQEHRAVIFVPAGTVQAETYDGVRIRRSTIDGSGLKVKFLKGEEYQGNRTLNVSPEVPTHPNTGGAQSPHVEHIALRVFQDMGVLAPGCDWYRIIEDGEHAQRIITQQPNERFLEMNQYDPDCNIYKIAYNEPLSYKGVRYNKQTNEDEGHEDLFALIDGLELRSTSGREQAVRAMLDIDKVLNYTVAGVLLSNWDGFVNNQFWIHRISDDKWECVPWDLDKTFGVTDGFPPHSTMFVEMPLRYPLNGRARLAGRDPGYITRPLLLIAEFYEEYIRRIQEALDGTFSQERIIDMVDQVETLLLQDLQLLKKQTGQSDSRRRQQIQDASNNMRTFMELRHEYLREQLPAAVENWSIF
jgi:hypothetical protein